ncbi:MAG: 50S ribosomal protein L29 [Candidatus Heimdallarchaeota archaeon]
MVLHQKEIRKMSVDERTKQLSELRAELLRIQGSIGMAGTPENPGKIRSIRKSIARILTVNREEELSQERSS